MIKRIKVKNFKSFDELDIELGPFNVLIGPNASGKSNFVQIFRFLRDIAVHGLDNAVSLQGDASFLQNLKIGCENPLEIEIILSYNETIRVRSTIQGGGESRLQGEQLIYSFSIKYDAETDSFKLIDERLRVNGEFIKGQYKDNKWEEKSQPEKGHIIYKKKMGTIMYAAESSSSDMELWPDTLPQLLGKDEDDFLLLQIRENMYVPPAPALSIFKHIGLYNLNPELFKYAQPRAGLLELQESGGNSAVVLKRVLADERRRKRFMVYLKDLLPFAEDLTVESDFQNFLMIMLKESYHNGTKMPGYLLSDGTMSIIGLIDVVLFENRPLIIIDEPDQDIHPFLASRIAEMMKEQSAQKQIIITTHNATMIKFCGLPNIRYVTRNEAGYSRITRLTDHTDVTAFLDNDMGLDELYAQNLLEP